MERKKYSEYGEVYQPVLTTQGAGINARNSIVVGVSSPDESRQLVSCLRTAGFSVTDAPTEAAFLEALRENPPDLALLDGRLPVNPEHFLDQLRKDPSLASVPLVLLVRESGSGSDTSILGPYAVDLLFLPPKPTELVRRVTNLRDRRDQQAAQREATEQLREAMREVSAQIRNTTDPAEMVGRFLAGVTRALGADQAHLQIFADERVPVLSSSYVHSGRSVGNQIPAASSDAAHRLAAAIWTRSAGVAFSPESADTDGDSASQLTSFATSSGVHSGVAIAVGQGETPFGLLWLMNLDRPLAWSAVENDLTQHVLGNLAYGMIQGQMIARQQQAVEKLRNLNKTKSDFVATVNHELRTPLASISGYLEMLLDGSGGQLPDTALPMLQAVDRNSTRLRNLVDDISALVPTEEDDSGHGLINICVLLGEVIRDITGSASTKGIVLDCAIPAAPTLVSGDRRQLDAALRVVLANAVKFSPAKGQVRIDAALIAPDCMAVTVADDGIGISAQDLPRLFDTFYRGENAKRMAVPGAGIGLSIAKRILDAHNASISIESSLGKGTKVSILLPVVAPA